MVAKIIHTTDKITLSKIDMATLHAIAERDGLTEIPDYMIFLINPYLYDEALERATKDVINRILEMSPDEISQERPAMRGMTLEEKYILLLAAARELYQASRPIERTIDTDTNDAHSDFFQATGHMAYIFAIIGEDINETPTDPPR